MKAQRVSLIAATTIGLALAPGVASAGGHDRVVGRGSIAFPIDVRVNAHSGPLGEKPSGTITIDAPSGRSHVKVSCLIVSGTTAVVGGLDETGFSRFLVVRDNGDTGDVATVGNGAPGPEPDQDACAAVLASVQFTFPVTGDFTVVDG